MIYTVILYVVILNLVLFVLIHFCQSQYFISKNILIFVKGISYELFIKIHVIPVVIIVMCCCCCCCCLLRPYGLQLHFLLIKVLFLSLMLLQNT